MSKSKNAARLPWKMLYISTREHQSSQDKAVSGCKAQQEHVKGWNGFGDVFNRAAKGSRAHSGAVGCSAWCLLSVELLLCSPEPAVP